MLGGYGPPSVCIRIVLRPPPWCMAGVGIRVGIFKTPRATTDARTIPARFSSSHSLFLSLSLSSRKNAKHDIENSDACFCLSSFPQAVCIGDGELFECSDSVAYLIFLHVFFHFVKTFYTGYSYTLMSLVSMRMSGRFIFHEKSVLPESKNMH